MSGSTAASADAGPSASTAPSQESQDHELDVTLYTEDAPETPETPETPEQETPEAPEAQASDENDDAADPANLAENADDATPAGKLDKPTQKLQQRYTALNEQFENYKAGEEARFEAYAKKLNLTPAAPQAPADPASPAQNPASPQASPDLEQEAQALQDRIDALKEEAYLEPELVSQLLKDVMAFKGKGSAGPTKEELIAEMRRVQHEEQQAKQAYADQREAALVKFSTEYGLTKDTIAQVIDQTNLEVAEAGLSGPAGKGLFEKLWTKNIALARAQAAPGTGPKPKANDPKPGGGAKPTPPPARTPKQATEGTQVKPEGADFAPSPGSVDDEDDYSGPNLYSA